MFEVLVVDTHGNAKPLEISVDDTILDLKNKIAQMFHFNLEKSMLSVKG